MFVWNPKISAFVRVREVIVTEHFLEIYETHLPVIFVEFLQYSCSSIVSACHLTQLTSLKMTQGTNVRGGLRPWVATPRPCSSEEPSSESAHPEMASGDVVVIPSSSRHASSEPMTPVLMIQPNRGTCSSVLGT